MCHLRGGRIPEMVDRMPNWARPILVGEAHLLSLVFVCPSHPLPPLLSGFASPNVPEPHPPPSLPTPGLTPLGSPGLRAVVAGCTVIQFRCRSSVIGVSLIFPKGSSDESACLSASPFSNHRSNRSASACAPVEVSCHRRRARNVAATIMT